MKTHYSFFAILCAVLLASQCAPEQIVPDIPTSKVDYSNLTIEEFYYPEAGEEGGVVNPVLKYSYDVTTTWSDGRVEKQTLSDGAEVAFSSTGEAIELDPETGEAKLPAASYTEAHSLVIEVSVALPDGSVATEEFSIILEALEDYVTNTSTGQLPIEIGEHLAAFENSTPEKRYISDSKDGYWPGFIVIDGENYYIDSRRIETLSAAGCDIAFSGGSLATITEWASGRRDTLVVEPAVFTTESTYTYGYAGEENPEYKPIATIEGNIWHIPCLRSYYLNISHTIKATVGDMETSLTMPQNNNEIVSSVIIDRWCEILSVEEPVLTRTVPKGPLPEFEDFLPGGWSYGAGKWYSFRAKDGDNSYLAYANGAMTRDLHSGDDANRAVQIYIGNLCLNLAKWEVTYRSDAKEQQTNDYAETTRTGKRLHGNWWYSNTTATMTATATVKTTNGSTRDIRHEWVWNSVPHVEQEFTMFIPEVKDAAEDFEWTISIDVELDETLCRVVWENPDYSKLHATFTIKDRRETFAQFCESQGIDGPFASLDLDTLHWPWHIRPIAPAQHGTFEWEAEADICDGLTREEYLNTSYDKLPGR